MASRTASSQPVATPTPTRPKRKKEQRGDIWSSLLRQTREAQARSRTQAVQARSLVLCGGSPEDQRAFVQSLTRPPPPAPPARNRDQRPQKPKGEVKLSNRYAYGYGHVTLFSPPQQSAGMLGAESEELANLELHTLPEPERGYEETLRRLLQASVQETEEDVDETEQDFLGGEKEGSRPAVAILMSWKEPWRFLALLRRWLQLLAYALVPANGPPEDPIGVLKDHKLSITLVVQHVEAQEDLEREGYHEESFEYISQCLRTCLLPLHAGLVYTSSNPPPQQPGSPLNEIQKVLYAAMDLDVAALSPSPPKTSTPTKREDLAPLHNFVDRMAIIIPSGWDSAAYIRMVSENFSPEAISEAWALDLNTPIIAPAQPLQSSDATPTADQGTESHDPPSPQANGGAPTNPEPEQSVFTTSSAAYDSEDDSADFLPGTPGAKSHSISHSAITTYEHAIQDPHAHKAPKPPTITVTTKKTQDFLKEMRSHIQALEAKDAESAKNAPSSTSNSGGAPAIGRLTGVPPGEQTGALDGLGDVSFNVGGVSYNATSAEAAIEKLKTSRPPLHRIESTGNSRTGTPQPPRRRERTAGVGSENETIATPIAATTLATQSKARVEGSSSAATAAVVDMPMDKLEEYFASLMKKGGGGSAGSTPSKGA